MSNDAASLALSHSPRIIVVLGAGDWVAKAYAPQLRRLTEAGRCTTYFIYKSGPDEQANKATRERVEGFAKWGAHCFDVSNVTHARKLSALPADTVFVATPDHSHIADVNEWIGRAAGIYVEKPFDVDSEKVRLLRASIGAVPTQVWGVDHYLIRALPILETSDGIHLRHELLEQLGGDIDRFDFHLTEPFDESLRGRGASLHGGVINDLASHVVALVLPFAHARTISLDRIKPGVWEKSEAADISGDEIFRDGRETFAEVDFTFMSFGNKEVSASAIVGKAVGTNHDKRLFVHGTNGAKLTLEFAHPFTAEITRADGSSEVVGELKPEPIEYLIDQTVEPDAPVPGFSLKVANEVVEALEKFSEPVARYIDPRGGVRLDTYPAGATLEDVRERLDWL